MRFSLLKLVKFSLLFFSYLLLVLSLQGIKIIDYVHVCGSFLYTSGPHRQVVPSDSTAFLSVVLRGSTIMVHKDEYKCLKSRFTAYQHSTATQRKGKEMETERKNFSPCTAYTGRLSEKSYAHLAGHP